MNYLLILISIVLGFADGELLLQTQPSEKLTHWLEMIVLSLVISLCVWLFLSGKMRVRLSAFAAKQRRLLISLSVILSLLATLSLLTSDTVIQIILLFLTFLLTITTLFTYGITFEFTQRQRTLSPWSWVKYTIPYLIMFAIFLITYFPAIMNLDAIQEWGQAQSHHYSDWQPVVYTWFIQLFGSIGNSPASVIIAQSLIMMAIFAFIMTRLEKFGVPHLWIWVLNLFFALCPINDIYAVTIWKDVLYSFWLLGLTFVTFEIIYSHGKWLEHKGHVVLLTVFLIGIDLFRNNGLPISLVSLFFIFLAYRKYYKSILISGLVSLIVSVFILIPVFQWLHVTAPNPDEVLGIPTQQIGMVIAHNGKMTAEEKSYFNKILPLKVWKEKYNPYKSDPIKFSAQYNQKVIFANKTTYFKHWAHVVMENPKLAIVAFLKVNSMTWQMKPYEDSYMIIFDPGVHANHYGLKQHSLNPSLGSNIERYVKKSVVDMKNKIWRPAIYLFIILLMAALAFMKNGWKTLLLIIPTLINTLIIAAAIPAQDFRYFYEELLVAPLLIILTFIRIKSNHDHVE